MFIDTHCHLSKKDDNFKEVIKEMKDNIMIVSGFDLESSKEVLKLVNEYSNIYGVIGIHPDEVDSVDKEIYNFLDDNIKNPKIVGIGEIGLDYYHNILNKEQQKELFINQIKIAQKYNKPIVIHSRESMNDTIEILKKMSVNNAVMHCYSGSLESAKELIKMGVKLGIGGVVTFKNSKKLKEVVAGIDLENILLETDSPYLAPEPFRGTINRPFNAYYVAKYIAELKEISLDEVLKITTLTAIKKFDLKV